MKKIYLIIACTTLLGYFSANAQCSIRTVTTKWSAANSNNTFDWSVQFYNNVYIKNRTYTNIPSPFYNPNSTFQNPNLIFLQNAAVKDLDPDDGWELLVKRFWR